MHTIFCLVGESGSGKTTVQKELEKQGLKSICSYTTREPRYEGEDNHIFCTEADYVHYHLHGDIVAYTLFGGNHYFCTREQVLESDLYAVDPDGVWSLREAMDEEVKIVVISIFVPLHDRIERMKSRGENQQQIDYRLAVDSQMFSEEKWRRAIPYEHTKHWYTVSNYDTLEKCVQEVTRIIAKYKQEEAQ